MTSPDQTDSPHGSTPLEDPERDEFAAFLSEVSQELEAAVDTDRVERGLLSGGEGRDALDSWFLDSPRVDWDWISLDERMIEEPR